jgi:hypothetical protein
MGPLDPSEYDRLSQETAETGQKAARKAMKAKLLEMQDLVEQ